MAQQREQKQPALEAQNDGTCPDCGRFVEICCSVHGHLEGDPWEENQRLREALREIRDQDWTENALDPQWSARIAALALTSRTREGS